MKLRFWDWNQRTALFLLTFGMILFNLPFFSARLWPQHDTIYAYQNFFTFYQQFFYHNELVRWYPYGTYGIKADLTQLFNLSPSAYFTGVFGKLLQIRNALFLFKFSLMIEELFFLIGLFFLSKFLFRDLKTVFFTCLAGIGSTVWYVQVYWNFRIYYLLPLIIYLFAKFMKERKGHNFWLCGIVFVCSFIGNLPYFTILYLPIILILLIALLLAYRSFPWKNIFDKSRINLAAFLICITIGIVYASFASRADDGIISYQKGRDPVNHSLDLTTFLTNGSGIGFEKFLGFLFEVPHENFTVYMGWLTLLFLLYALWKVKKPEFWGMVACGIFLALLSAGGETPFAALIYRTLPPMKWFQYIGQIASLGRLFFILAAGFGLEYFLDHFERRNKRDLLILSVILIVTFFILLKRFSGAIPFYVESLKLYYFTAVLLFSLVVWLIFRAHEAKRAAFLILTFLFLDFLFYQFALADSWANPRLLNRPEPVTIAPSRYQPIRLLEPEFRLYPKRTMVEQNPIERLTIDAFNFMQVDPCLDQYASLLVPENVWRYLEIRANYTRTRTEKGFLTKWQNSLPFFYEIGCHVPKIRLVGNALIASNALEAENLLKSNQDINKIVILDPKGQAPKSPETGLKQSGTTHVQSFSYNRIEIEANVTNPSGAWLYYADSYHPDWKATVNGLESPIYATNIAFKSVFLPSGPSRVAMNFDTGKSAMFSKIIASIGFLFATVLILMTGIQFLKTNNRNKLSCN